MTDLPLHGAREGVQHVYFNRVLRRVRLLSPDALARLLDEAEAAGRLTPAESEDLRLADVLARGMRREDGAEAYLAGEISGLVELDDVARAARRAELLARATGRPAIAAVAGERISPDVDRIARQSGVWRVLDGAALPPSVEVPSSSSRALPGALRAGAVTASRPRRCARGVHTGQARLGG